MARFRKKPVVIEAFQMTKERRWDNSEWPIWLNMAWQKDKGETGAVWPDPDIPDEPNHESARELVVATLEGVMRIGCNDYIIQGAKGEIYACKPDVFKMTYEKVDEDGKTWLQEEG